MPKMVSMPEGTPLAAEDFIPKEKTTDKAVIAVALFIIWFAASRKISWL